MKQSEARNCIRSHHRFPGGGQDFAHNPADLPTSHQVFCPNQCYHCVRLFSANAAKSVCSQASLPRASAKLKRPGTSMAGHLRFSGSLTSRLLSLTSLPLPAYIELYRHDSLTLVREKWVDQVFGLHPAHSVASTASASARLPSIMLR